MAYRPRRDIGYCRFDRCTIVLDTRADRYWQFGKSVGEALSTLEAGAVLEPDEFDRLMRLKLIEPVGAKTYDPPFVPPSPRSSALDTAAGDRPFSVRLATEVLLCQLGARLALSILPLRIVLLATARHRLRAKLDANCDQLAALARAFRRYRSLLPWTPLCLPDTIAFVRFAARHGFAPRLLFGVEAYPFAAHCWAQQDDLVLNDAFDHAVRFSPIYVL